MLDTIVSAAPFFLLVAVRCFGMIMTLPLTNSRSISRIAKIAICGYAAFFLFPQVSLTEGSYAVYAEFISPQGSFNLQYILCLLGEGFIGVILGFYINMIFAAFSTAGQFFSFQMGFSAAEAYDSLSQVENTLMGQYLNFVGLLVFLSNNWFQKLFLKGLEDSFKSINALSIVEHNDDLVKFMLSGLTHLFMNALLIALPVMATLFLINGAMGILSKASPQMNMLSEGFPILIMTTFFILTWLMPQLVNLFTSSFDDALKEIQNLYLKLGGQIQK